MINLVLGRYLLQLIHLGVDVVFGGRVIVWNKHDVAWFAVERGTLVLELIQNTLLFEEAASLRVEDGYGRLEYDNDVYFMHNHLDYWTSLALLIWLVLIELECDVTFLTLYLVHEEALVSIVQNKAATLVQAEERIILLV